jgi:hypothetical protein
MKELAKNPGSTSRLERLGVSAGVIIKEEDKE